MRLEDLNLQELLSSEPGTGILRFGDERVLLFDAVALGLLRRQLIDDFGRGAARGLLTRFGFAHGWRTAETARRGVPWTDERQWQLAGGRLHMLQGWVRFQSAEASSDQSGAPFAEALWHDSYEAEQHLSLVGRSDDAVCWTLCGYASGYLSFVQGREVYCIEQRCVGRGDRVCHMLGRPREQWGDEILPHLPFFEHAFLEGTLAHATQALKRTEQELGARRRELARVAGARVIDPSGIVAASAEMRQVLDLARRVARADSSVLVSGESGVGKERVARFLHDESPRAAGPFVAINCGAVPDTLIESELFGHARGSFTGATRDRTGLFEEASKGSLLLDEVGELTPATQVKLLRALQTHEVRRVGENRPRKVDVRLIAATHRDLAEEVRKGRFRQDLFYRLKVIEIHVPPLRERKPDLLPLARVLLADAAARASSRVSGLSPAAADQLLCYDWPGNVRELDNAMQRAVLLASGSRVRVEDLPEEVRGAVHVPRARGTPRTLADVEREYVLAVLDKNGGHRAKTAAELGIGTATLFRKLKQYGITSSG
jgi:two-component system, NtrC family, response regulator HydG